MANVNAQAIASLLQELLAAISAVGPIGVELFLKLEALLQLGGDEAANVAAAIKAGLAADAETIAAVEAWKKQVGM
jgi:hypothetical protein